MIAPSPSPTPMPVAPALPLTGTGRLTSIDALRGFDMFWIIGGDELAQAVHKMCGDRVTGVIATEFGHCDWAGFHIEDLIFPLFVFIAGVSLVFSLTKTIEREGRSVAMRRLVRRGLLLVLVGLIYYGGISHGWGEVRLLGVLQRIGLAYLGAGLLFCLLSRRGLIIACCALLIGYWAVMTFVPIRDIHLNQDTFSRLSAQTGISDQHELFNRVTTTVSGHFDPGYNLSDHIDFQYLPLHKWDGFYDPEGLLSTLPAIATCLLGVFAGMFLRDRSRSTGRKLALMVGAGVAMVLLGELWGLQFPVVKKIWTSSFVLVAGGWSVLLLAAFHWLIDVRGKLGWALPFIWIGTNAIVFYLLGKVADMRGIANCIIGGPVAQALDVHIAAGLGEVVGILGSFGLIVMLAWYLHRRQIFLRL